MKTTLNFKQAIAITMIAMLSFTSCWENNNPGGGTDPDNPVWGKMEEISLEGIVLNPDGNPLSGVKVSTGTEFFTTGSDGCYTFSKADVVNNRVSVRFEKSGYFTVTRSQRKDNAEAMYIEAVLNPSGNSGNSAHTTFDSSKGTTIALASGMKIEFPAAAIMRANGSAFNGKVTVDALYLDPNHELFSSMMSGDIAALDKDGKKSTILSNGIVDVELKDDAGKPLQVKTGSTAKLTFPIPEDSDDDDLSATLSLYYYSEAKAVWVEEATATRQGNVYVADVNHFSKWNWAYYRDQVKADVLQRVKVVDCDGKPFPNARITIEQKETLVTTSKKRIKGFGVTDSKGMANVMCLTWIPANVTAEAKGMTDSKTTVPVANIELAPLTGDDIVVYTEKLVELKLCNEVKSATIRYHSGDEGEYYVTFDNFGKQRRMDIINWSGINRDVIIYDEINGLYCSGERDNDGKEEWETMDKWDAHDGTQYQLFEEYNPDTFMMLTYLTLIGGTQKTQTVAGQKCEVYRLKGAIWAVWGGTVLLWFGTEEGGKLEGQIAKSAETGCHPKAFTQTFIY